MPHIPSGEWTPVGVDDLEPAAWSALRSDRNSYVVAGPGAGKTELLAQRAAFLLQTGICAEPHRILAISFKRDAAQNLRERVRRRCSAEQSRRLISVTFDAFTKGIVDRFRTVLPELWKLDGGYEVSRAQNTEVRDHLKRVIAIANPSWKFEISRIDRAQFEARNVGTWELPLAKRDLESGTELAVLKWWMRNLRENRPATLTFTMFNRLAEAILRSNDQIRRALLYTYPYVFVDECQDTTFAQYDFLKSVFKSSGIVITAVGDEKQRIMGWAGAMPNMFTSFRQDFGADRILLRCNYRSSPDLVRIQQVLARKLDSSCLDVESRAPSKISDGCAEIWSFTQETEEAEHLASWVHQDMTKRNCSPRDYVLLVRQTADLFEHRLSPQFESLGIRIRNESRQIGRSTVQDLLAEPLTSLGLALLRVATRNRDPNSWNSALETLMFLRGIDDSDLAGCIRVQDELTSFIRDLKAMLSHLETSSGNADITLGKIAEFIDLESLQQVFPEYRGPENISIAAEAFGLHLANSAEGAPSWDAALDIFEGVGCIPLMTVHKSKGLEFDTVLFVGLDDKTWWSYTTENPEGLATFFVALSRAKQRAIFTYCSQRGARTKVADLFTLLHQAGVPEKAISLSDK